jgi:hypothetical protein
MKKYNVEYEIGEIVYLVTDEDQKTRMVTGILLHENGVSYRLAQGINENWAIGCEISNDKNYKI